MLNFAYHAPTSLAELLKLRSESPHSALLAGGTDLIIKMRANRISSELVLDTKRVPDFVDLSIDENELHLGAAVSCWRIYNDPGVRKSLPGLLDCARLIGGTAIQGRASIGGNLCNAAPSGDAIPMLIALNTTATIVGPDSNRIVPVEEFCTGPGENCLRSGESLVSLKIPIPKWNSGARFLRFIPRNEMDIAVANAAVNVKLDPSGNTFESARIAIGSVGPTPLFLPEVGKLLQGRTVSADTVEEAGALASSLSKPIDDMRGSAVQRRQLVKVLVNRAIGGAVVRARETAS